MGIFRKVKLLNSKDILKKIESEHVFRNYLLNDGNCKFFCTLSKENDKNDWKKKEKYVPLPQIWITMSSLYPYETD